MKALKRFLENTLRSFGLLIVIASMLVAVLMEVAIYVLAGATIVNVIQGITSGAYNWDNIAAYLVLAVVFKFMGTALEKDGRLLYKKVGFKHSGSEEECPVTGAKATGYYDNGSKYE